MKIYKFQITDSQLDWQYQYSATKTNYTRGDVAKNFACQH